MIPFPNQIAGIAIGIVTDSWILRLILPFVWGGIFSILKLSFKEFELVELTDEFGKQTSIIKRRPTIQFSEYLSAVKTSLFFSLIFGAIKSLVLAV